MRHIPWLRELPLAGRYSWAPRIELNPKDADRLGVRRGDRVRVESVAGGCALTVEVSPGIRPGNAGLPLGHGAWPPDPSEVQPGGQGLLANLSDPLAGVLALQGTRVRIRKEIGL